MATNEGEEKDWLSGRSLAECNRFMLANQLGCDVTFLSQSKPTSMCWLAEVPCSMLCFMGRCQKQATKLKFLTLNRKYSLHC